MLNLKTIFITFFLTLFFGLANAQYKHDSLKISIGYLHYYVEGKGDPIVYLQGGPGYSGIDLKQVADSFPNHQNILIDYEGTGLSQYREADTSWVTIDNIIANIEAVRTKLEIKKWIILGHSYGTHFGLYYAVKYPQHVSKLLLVAACGTNNEFQKYFKTNIVNRFSYEDTIFINKIWSDSTLTAERKTTIIDSMFLKPYFYDKNKLGFYLATIPKEYLPTYYNDKFFRSYLAGSQFNNFNLDNQVKNLNIPILLLQGRQDPIGDAIPVLLQQKLKNCKLEFINKCGHFVWVEKPKEFYEIARAFLKT
jgi:proline iminopeptidase